MIIGCRSGPAAGLQVHREETEVKEGSTAMGDLDYVKAGTRRFEGPVGPDATRVQGGES